MALRETTSSRSHPRVPVLVPPDARLLAFEGLRMSWEASWDDRDAPGRGRASFGKTRISSGKAQEGSADLPEGSSDLSEGSSDLPEGSSDLPEGSSDLLEGSSDLQEGSLDLPEGSSDLPEGSFDLSEGSSDLLEGSSDLLECQTDPAEAPSFPLMARDIMSAARLLPTVTKIVHPMACEEGAAPRRVIESGRQSTHEAPESTLAALRLGTQHKQSDGDGYPMVEGLFLVDADVEHVALALSIRPAQDGSHPLAEEVDVEVGLMAGVELAEKLP